MCVLYSLPEWERGVYFIHVCVCTPTLNGSRGEGGVYFIHVCVCTPTLNGSTEGREECMLYSVQYCTPCMDVAGGVYYIYCVSPIE